MISLSVSLSLYPVYTVETLSYYCTYSRDLPKFLRSRFPNFLKFILKFGLSGETHQLWSIASPSISIQSQVWLAPIVNHNYKSNSIIFNYVVFS